MAIALAETPVVLAFGGGEKRKRSVKPPPRVAVSDVTPNNLGTVRQLCKSMFPVSYSDKFYQDVLLPEVIEYCQLVFYNDIPVGVLTSRLERIPNTNDARLYIATLGVLAPYRRQGLATKLLNHIIEQARSSWAVVTPDPAPAPIEDKKKKGAAAPAAPKTTAPTPPPRIVGLKVHVQTNNESARDFWMAQSFQLTETIDKYYTRIDPASAWVLEKTIADPTKETATVA